MIHFIDSVSQTFFCIYCLETAGQKIRPKKINTFNKKKYILNLNMLKRKLQFNITYV